MRRICTFVPAATPTGASAPGRKLYEITIPGLSMKADLPAVRQRLLADFPQVLEVLAMTTPVTVLVAYTGEDEVDAWCEALSDAVVTRRIGLSRSHIASPVHSSNAA
jgi:hypothetical protein